MKATTKLGSTALAVLGMAAGAVFAPAAASAATPALPSLVAYVRGGDVYVSKGAAETRLTTDGGYARPRWSPDGKQIALLKGGRLWVMKANGTAKRLLTTRAASGPSWAPDGKSIAFASLTPSPGRPTARRSPSAAAPANRCTTPA
jgi:dipeptidyl aminopeptidase/acylaminoacyl peptidase